MKCLLVDHYDSFTYNVAQWIMSTGVEVQVCKWDSAYEKMASTKDFIVFSPGPGCPEEYSQSLEFLEKNRGKLPILGICLGMQLMLHLEGLKIQRDLTPVHGKVNTITLGESSLFNGMEKETVVARYHSLGFLECGSYNSIAHFNEIIMGVEHRDHKYIGLQFHPESFLTEKYNELAHNLIDWVKGFQ